MIERVRKFLQEGNPRSVLAKRHILGSLLVKGTSICISLLLVPLTISYVNPARYGIWLVLSSMVGWVSFFDIGFTNGLRNRFAEAKARGDVLLARTYVSTAYLFLGGLFGGLMVLLLVLNQFCDWGALLNLPNAREERVGAVAAIIISYFCLLFVLRIVNTVLMADLKPALASFLDLLGQLISLAVIFVLTKVDSGSLIHLTLALCLPTVLVLLLAQLVLYNTTCAPYAPTLRLARSRYVKDIMGLGLKFFIPNLACIVQYQTTSFLIAHYFDVTQVTAYNIAYRYFAALQMLFNIATTPLWSSVTDSYHRGDQTWIRHVVKRYLHLLLLFAATALLMLAFSGRVYDLWIGRDRLVIDFNISLLCCLFVLTGMFANIFVSVLNGVGALKLQFVSSMFTPVLFILLSLLLVLKLRTGVEGILLASIFSNVFGVVIAPIQYYQIFIGKSSAKVWYA